MVGQIPPSTEYHRALGVAQIGVTTIDLNQAAAGYDLFTATLQDVLITAIAIRMPAIVGGGALTGISIQTDDATPQIFIPAGDGLVANLTSEAQLQWTGAVILDAGTGAKIQLTIVGGAHGVAYVCDVICGYQAVVAGGYLS